MASFLTELPEKAGILGIEPKPRESRQKLLLSENIIEELFGNPEKLENIVVLHINHCMENSFEFCRVLSAVFKTVIFVGAPYNNMMPPIEDAFTSYAAIDSKNQNVYDLYRNGVICDTFKGGFIDVVHKLIVQAMTTDIFPLLEKEQKLLVIEDGGYHYKVFRELSKQYPILRSNVLGSVEQTTSGTLRGYDLAGNLDYWYPHMSVARSNIKTNIESRFIAERVVEELSRFLYGINAFLDFHEILLVGYGVIGRAIAQLLKGRAADVCVYDSDPAIMNVAADDGLMTVTASDYGGFPTDTVLIGNTGTSSLNEHMLSSFFAGKGKKLYLASSSSQDVEFQVFLDMANAKRPFPKNTVLKAIYTSTGVDEYVFSCIDGKGCSIDKSIFLIAKGRPVNFFRTNVISLTNCMIDLVFAQMLLMASWLCDHPDAEKRLYMLGTEKILEEKFPEEELLERWLSLYHLSVADGRELLRDSHPAKQLLQKHFFNRGCKDGKH